MDRIANYFFLLALVVIFVLQADAEDHLRILAGGLGAILFCVIAFIVGWLTLDGARSAAIAGTIVFGLGGLPAAGILLFFFLSSTLVSQKSFPWDERRFHSYPRKVRRDGLQVWSNGFWFTLFLLPGFIFREQLFWLAASGALASATADTWATELGSKRFAAKTYLLDRFQKVEPGTDGGISLPGTAAALAGSLATAMAAGYLYSFNISLILCIFLAGFLGCLADSYFGAAFQLKKRSIRLPLFFQSFETMVDNNRINWMSTGIASLLTILLKLLLV